MGLRCGVIDVHDAMLMIGTLITPVAVVPRLAAAVPTVKAVSPCCCAAAVDARTKMNVVAWRITVFMDHLVHVVWNGLTGCFRSPVYLPDLCQQSLEERRKSR